MAILDDIPNDPSPIKATLDFSQYVDGEKLSTLARNYFSAKGPELGANTIEEYFAQLLLLKLKETLAEEAVQQIYASSVEAAELLAKEQAAEAEAQKIIAAQLIEEKIAEIELVELVKK
jgi:hypothetical protein